MMQEDKDLLLKDLCARLPYGVMVNNPMTGDDDVLTYSLLEDFEAVNSDYPKPYLRPMSSMTEEEEGEYNLIQGLSHLDQHWTANDGKVYRYADAIDWLNKKMFDYRGLIPKELALIAPEGMYNVNI